MSKKLLLFCIIMGASISLIIFYLFRKYEYRDYSSPRVESEMLVARADFIGSFSADKSFVRGSPYCLRLSVKTKPGFYFDYAKRARLRGHSNGSNIIFPKGKIFGNS